MEFVGRKVIKNVGARAWSGSVESYDPATGVFQVVYDDGVYEEMGLAEVSPLLMPVEGNAADVGGNPPAVLIDLNICQIDLTDDGEGAAGLHGVDLNEGVNHILHEDVASNPNSKRKMIDLNLEAAKEEEAAAEEQSSSKRARLLFDLNVELKEAEADDAAHLQQAVAAEDRALMPPPKDVDATTPRWRPTEESTSSFNYYVEDLRRQLIMAKRHNFSIEQYALLGRQFFSQFQIPVAAPSPPAAPVVLLPPKVELPPSSANLDLKGASLMDFLSVYSFLRSFSVTLFISPFQIHDFASCVMSNDSTSLFDAIHLSLLTMLRRHLKSLSDDQGSVSASLCLSSLNWDFLDAITWPVFLYEYLTFHSPKYIPGLAELSKDDAFVPFQSDYYAMPASAKMAILRHLCDEVVETEACRSEVNRRVAMMERNNWRSRYFSCKVVKKVAKAGDGASTSCMVEEYTNDFVDDGNGDECYLCRAAGALTCCDGWIPNS